MERFAVNGVPCEQNDFADIMLDIRNRIEKWTQKNVLARQPYFKPTYFELTTLFAFVYFARKKVDFAILEVGLGGRLDATNICSPLITIITSISFDHIQQLGPTLWDISLEKAGIIKPGIPIISGTRKKEAKEAIRSVALSRNAPLFEIETDFEVVYNQHFPKECISFNYFAKSRKFQSVVDFSQLLLPVLGEHQARNAALAITAMLLLREKYPMPNEAIRAGLQSVQLPARIELFGKTPIFIIDGAHNRASVQELLKTIQNHFGTKKRYALFGTMLDKDVEGMFLEILPFFDWIIFTQSSSHQRCFPAKGLRNIALSQLCSERTEFCSQVTDIAIEANLKFSKGEVISDWKLAFQKIRNIAGEQDLVCITGSFYLAADVRKYLRSVE